MKEGGEVAQNLVELYEFCRKNISNYLEDKKIEKLEEVHAIFSKLSEGWQGISPDKKNI
jgi:flagellin-specific chaperone FliS